MVERFAGGVGRLRGVYPMRIEGTRQMDVRHEIATQVEALPPEMREQVLRFVASLAGSAPKGECGATLRQFSSSVGFARHQRRNRAAGGRQHGAVQSGPRTRGVHSGGRSGPTARLSRATLMLLVNTEVSSNVYGRRGARFRRTTSGWPPPRSVTVWSL